MVDQNDQKHESGHGRLRRDLTKGFNEVNGDMEVLRRNWQSDHERLIKIPTERRKELSAQKTVVLAAIIGGGFHLIEVIINAAVTLLHHS